MCVAAIVTAALGIITEAIFVTEANVSAAHTIVAEVIIAATLVIAAGVKRNDRDRGDGRGDGSRCRDCDRW